MRHALCLMISLVVFTNPAGAQTCTFNSSVPSLDQLGTGVYKTFQGGLYAGESNQRPSGHEAAGLAIAEVIETLNTNGLPAPEGRITMISIGMSNWTQEWASGAVGEPASIALTFTAKANALRATGEVNPAVRIVDGAQGGVTADEWAAPPNFAAPPWSTVLSRLASAGSSRFQVQVACLKNAHAQPQTCIAADGSTLGDAGTLAVDYAQIARNLKAVFPNIKLAYMCSRTYGGYAISPLNPEPYAYESGFAAKWVIDSQVQADGRFGNLNYDANLGPMVAPWLSWGAYLWANGTTPNGYGVFWLPEDFRANDRTHPSGAGVDKVGTELLQFFLSDTTTRPWFGWQCLHGDTNLSGDVSAADIPSFVAALLNPGALTVGQRCRTDANNDGLVDGNDVGAMVDKLIGG